MRPVLPILLAAGLLLPLVSSPASAQSDRLLVLPSRASDVDRMRVDTAGGVVAPARMASASARPSRRPARERA